MLEKHASNYRLEGPSLGTDTVLNTKGLAR